MGGIEQERLAAAALAVQQWGEALVKLQEAEEIYRNLSRELDSRGLLVQAGRFFHRSMVMHRLQLPRFGWRRLGSKTLDILCGYGEYPARVIAFSAVVIGFCALVFFFTGVDAAGTFGLDASLGFSENLERFVSCVNLSAATFTPHGGFRDPTPIGWSRATAALEAFVGAFTLALFVVVFVEKMTR